MEYVAPLWACEPAVSVEYGVDVIKDGCIIQKISFHKSKSSSFVVIGRADDCDIQLVHPSVSRYHCVLQYGENLSVHKGKGWFIYDLGSHHKTKLNKKEIPAKTYKRVEVGYIMQFGLSTRLVVLLGPDSDRDKEWVCSPSQMIQLAQLKKAELKAKKEEEEKQEQKKIADGISWGMDDDYVDYGESSFIEFDKVLDDSSEWYRDEPVKALKKYFEREGYDMEFVYQETGTGFNRQWSCSIDLPINSSSAKSSVTETSPGSKKDAQRACALAACRTLAIIGELNRSKNEAKRKINNLEENDFYESDEDTFFDRTGQIEEHRESRKRRADEMKYGKKEEKETYEGLLKKIAIIEQEILEQQSILDNISKNAQQFPKFEDSDSPDVPEDEQSKSDYIGLEVKMEKSKLRLKIVSLKHEKEWLEMMARIAKPAELAVTKKSGNDSSGSISTASLNKLLNMRRKKISTADKCEKEKPKLPTCSSSNNGMFNVEEEEVDEEEESDVKKMKS